MNRQPMRLDEARFEILRLTLLRRRVVKENDTISRLFAPLTGEQPPSWETLDKEVRQFEAGVPGFILIYAKELDAYALLPVIDVEVSNG